MTLERFNDKYIKPYIMVEPENNAMRILRHNEEIQVNEARTYIKQHGSFAGMPTVQSKSDLLENQKISIKGIRFEIGLIPNKVTNFRRTSLSVPSNALLARVRPIPRNESIGRFVREKLAELNSVTFKGSC